ncbi:MAG: FHA domain-containing protein [Bdellovibrio sp.]|nr:FHA domain-containing protein [Bdellovibrio sp.]
MGACKKIVVTIDSAGSKSLFESEQSDVIVGRSKKADLRLAFEGMSREHFALQEKEGILYIKDLGSANGTMVNGVLISKEKYRKLTPKDKIEVKGLALKIDAKVLDFSVPVKQAPKVKSRPEPLPAQLDAPEVLADLDERELALAREIIIEASPKPQPVQPLPQETVSIVNQQAQDKEMHDRIQAQAMELLSSAEKEAKELIENAHIRLAQIKEAEIKRWHDAWQLQADQELAWLREKVKAEESTLVRNNLQQQQMQLEKEWQIKVAEEKEKLAQQIEEAQKDMVASAHEKGKKILAEAELNSQGLIEDARKMAKEVRDQTYKESMALKDQALEAYEKQRNQALSIYQETLDRAAAQAEKLLKEAKQEIEGRESKLREHEAVSKMQTEESLLETESKARKIIHEATTQAQQLIESARAEEKQLKEDAEKLLKNSYATALAMATASDAVNFTGDFPELKSVEFKKIEELHHFGLENLDHLKRSTGHELADVQKKKISALAEEEKNLRERMYERIQLEAQEDALRIKQAAEKNAEEILAQAYTLSKRLSAETQHKYLADKNRIEQEIKILDEKNQTADHMNSELQAALHEGELKKRYLMHELEQLSLEEATYNHKLGLVKEELAQARHEHAEFVKEIKENEAQLRQSVQEQREERIAHEAQVMATRKEWDCELANLGEEVANLREEKTSCLQIMQETQVQLTSTEAETRRLEDEKQNLECLLKEYEQKIVQAQNTFEEMLNEESEMRHKLDATTLLFQQAQQNEQEINNRCQQMIQQSKAESDQMRKQLEDERTSLDHLKKAQEKLVREEAQEYQKKIYQEARLEGQKICAQLVEEGRQKKAQILEKVREMQERIEATNLEMSKKEQEMKEYQERKMMEAQKEAIALTESVQQEIQSARQCSEEEGRKLLADVHARAEQIISQAEQQKAMAQDTIQDEIDTRRRAIDTELENYKSEQTREMAQIKIRELETLKQKEKEFSEKWEMIREDAIQEISENMRVNLLMKFQECLQPTMTSESVEQFKTRFMGSIQEVVRAAIYPPNQENAPRAKGLLQGKGKVARKVKIFWLKIGLSIGIPIVLIFVHLMAPNFYSNLYRHTLGKLVNGDSYSNNYVENEIALSRNRPKFNPTPTPGFKLNYTDNVIYTQGYRDLVLNAQFIEEWTKDCNRFLEQELRMSDETIVALVSHENNMHEQLVPLFLKINPDFEKEGVARMREVEAEYYPKIKGLFPDEAKFAKFYKFKEDYFFQKLNQSSR